MLKHRRRRVRYMTKRSGTMCAPRFAAQGPMARWWTGAKKMTKILKYKKWKTSREVRGGEKMLKYFPANVIYLCQWGSIAQSFCKALRWEGGQRGLYAPASHNIHNPDVSVAEAARSTAPCGKAYIFSNLLEGLLDTFKVSRSCDFHHHILFGVLFF